MNIDKAINDFIVNENIKKTSGRPDNDVIVGLARRGRPKKDNKITDMKAYMKEYNKEYYKSRRVLKDKTEYKKLGRPKKEKEIKEIIIKERELMPEFMECPNCRLTIKSFSRKSHMMSKKCLTYSCLI